MKKLFLIFGLIFNLSLFAEPTNITWHDYEILCYKSNREPTYEEYTTLQKDSCFGEEEKEIIKLFEKANEGEDQ